MSVEIIDLLNLAQYALSAAHQKLNNRLDPSADALLAEWCKANPLLRAYLKEHPVSSAQRAARLALGMLVRPQLARDAATMECAALMQHDGSLQDQFAVADWEGAADIISRDVIDTYHGALLAVTEVQR